jgi:transcriptional regulator with XRE-family HTH domain
LKSYENSAAAQLIANRIWELSSRKSQAAIASEVGFASANMMTQLKTGRAKVPLDRALPLAQALEIDPSLLLRLALEQAVGAANSRKIVEILSESVGAEGCQHSATGEQ